MLPGALLDTHATASGDLLTENTISNGTHVATKAAPAQLNASLLQYAYANEFKHVPAFGSAEHWGQRTCTDHSPF